MSYCDNPHYNMMHGISGRDQSEYEYYSRYCPDNIGSHSMKISGPSVRPQTLINQTIDSTNSRAVRDYKAGVSVVPPPLASIDATVISTSAHGQDFLPTAQEAEGNGSNSVLVAVLAVLALLLLSK